MSATVESSIQQKSHHGKWCHGLYTNKALRVCPFCCDWVSDKIATKLHSDAIAELQLKASPVPHEVIDCTERKRLRRKQAETEKKKEKETAHEEKEARPKEAYHQLIWKMQADKTLLRKEGGSIAKGSIHEKKGGKNCVMLFSDRHGKSTSDDDYGKGKRLKPDYFSYKSVSVTQALLDDPTAL